MIQVTWWKPWKPDPTVSMSSSTESTTSRNQNKEDSKPIDISKIDCDRQSYWAHADCSKVFKENIYISIQHDSMEY